MLSDILDCLAGNFIYPLEGHYRVWNRGPKRQNCLNLFECHSNVKHLSFIFASFGRTVTRLKLCSRWPSLGLFGLPPSPSAPPPSPLSLPPSPFPPSPPPLSTFLLRLFHLLLRLPDFPLISCLPGSLQVLHGHVYLHLRTVYLHLCSCLLVQSKFQLTSCQGQGISLSRRTDSANENEKTGLFWGTKCSSPLQSEPGRQKRLTSDESCLSESQLFRLSFQVLSFQFLSVSFTFCLKKQNCWTLDDLSRANMSHAT